MSSSSYWNLDGWVTAIILPIVRMRTEKDNFKMSGSHLRVEYFNIPKYQSFYQLLSQFSVVFVSTVEWWDMTRS